ncbi:hypothetical protein HMPREF7215_2657 [Pyramidobacter piscolens W5455]|uniref:Uncharacterized protein n=1 Tax=Pyramidobacter piscolens W5455 TaxID=352165 RepID=A0ABP2HUN2_9BACT|nr:hypothetical protein HMPREF7215_2657 [Pyramidobacter piscolens W5455]
MSFLFVQKRHKRIFAGNFGGSFVKIHSISYCKNIKFMAKY